VFAQCGLISVPLRRPTDDTLALAKAAADGMRSCISPATSSSKSG